LQSAFSRSAVALKAGIICSSIVASKRSSHWAVRVSLPGDWRSAGSARYAWTAEVLSRPLARWRGPCVCRSSARSTPAHASRETLCALSHIAGPLSPDANHCDSAHILLARSHV